MGPSRLVADLTGRCQALARRLGLSTRSSRYDDLHAGRRLPPAAGGDAVTAGGGLPIRVLVLGNGPAESPGLQEGEGTFSSRLAEALTGATGRPVRITTVVGGGWDLPELAQRLHDEQLHWHDALVVTAAYRPSLAEIPIARWREYVLRLKAVLIDAAGPDTAIRVLSLPWRSAVRDAPEHWGGAFGNRVVALAETAEATLRGERHALHLRLDDPVDAREWAGPAFSARTYLRWADQVAADLAPALRPTDPVTR